MRLKWTELFQNSLRVALWFDQLPRSLRGEEGQVEELVQSRAQRLRLFWVQGGRLAGSPGGSGGQGRLSGGTLGQRGLLLVIIVVLLPLLV